MRSPGRQVREPLTAYRRKFGNRLRQLREQQEVSQEDLAHRLDMSPRYLGGIERGLGNPTLDVIVRLAEGLEVEVADLMPPRRRARR